MPPIWRAGLSTKPEVFLPETYFEKSSVDSAASGSSSMSRTPFSAGTSEPRRRRYSAVRDFKNTMPPVPSVRMWKNSQLTRFLK